MEKKVEYLESTCGYTICRYLRLRPTKVNGRNGPILHKGHILSHWDPHYRERKMHCEVPNSNNKYVQAIGSQEPHLGVQVHLEDGSASPQGKGLGGSGTTACEPRRRTGPSYIYIGKLASERMGVGLYGCCVNQKKVYICNPRLCFAYCFISLKDPI